MKRNFLPLHPVVAQRIQDEVKKRQEWFDASSPQEQAQYREAQIRIEREVAAEANVRRESMRIDPQKWHGWRCTV
jgi:hypothetical protein